MAKLSKSSLSPVDLPRFETRLLYSNWGIYVFMVPVSLFSGYVTYYAGMQWLALISKAFPNDWNSDPYLLVVVCASMLSGSLTLGYFLVQLDRTYSEARCRGKLNSGVPQRCPKCQAALVIGQVLCACCGIDLREVTGTIHVSLHLRRQILVSHVLATIPLANAAGTIAALAAALLLGLIGGKASDTLTLIALGSGFAAAGCVAALRVPRTILLWRLLMADLHETEADSSIEPSGIATRAASGD